MRNSEILGRWRARPALRDMENLMVNEDRVEITEKDRELAEGCLNCPVCKHARKKQRGILYWFVKKIEGGVCPQCKAYEKVYGRKAHERISES